MRGTMPEEGINPVEFPAAAAHVWEWFTVLNAKRAPGISGPLPIAESEIGWFFLNRRMRAEAWELDAIARLDQAAMQAHANNT